MANDLLADECDERRDERIGPAQLVDDARFSSVAARQAGKRASGKRPNGVVVGDRFLEDQNRQALPVAQRVVIQSWVKPHPVDEHPHAIT